MRPAEITRYISLITEQDCEEIGTRWYQCVRSRAPQGLLATVEVSDNTGKRAAAMVKRVGQQTSYVIPLARDLMEEEANRIIAAFSATEEGDFDIEATVVRTGENGTSVPKINVAQERYMEVCSSLARKQHEDWVKTRAQEGWRYGPEVSIADKTHPLLRPWDQLPDRYRVVDFEQPKRFVDLLTQHGYAVISRDDLDALFRQVRRKG